MILELRTTWSSGHLYVQEKWDLAKNQETFGKCFSEHGHGHDYVLKVRWKFQTESQQEVETSRLQACLQLLREKLDHHHLNFKIPEFKNEIPTTENLALYCRDFLQQELKNQKLTLVSGLKLFETPNLWVELRL